MLILLSALLSRLCSMFRSHAVLELENIALRHQIGVPKRSARKRPKLTPVDGAPWGFCGFARWSVLEVTGRSYLLRAEPRF